MTSPGRSAGPPGRRREAVRFVVLTLVCALVFAGFVGLGVWQLQRRVWKLELIAHVDQRIHAAPAPAPGPAEWPTLDAQNSAYRRVEASGVFLNDKETLVEAVTDLGPGFWVMTPLRTERGFTILVNRGFVPPERREPQAHGAKAARLGAHVIGLLRITEPHGGFLRANDPLGGRWYSRDVAAIAKARGLTQVAPYFIDAEATPSTPGAPVGGLTVVRFPNSHLIYALTWFGMALTTVGAWLSLVRAPVRGRAQ